jgi:serine/threonine protein kinase|tara:strand:+ start:257 stop:529 length:273 start_codon:yes stop_codon:yes gene_type:complete
MQGIPNLGEELLKTKVVANRLRNMQKFCDSASNCSADLFVRNDNSPNSFNNYSDLARFVKSLLKAVEILHATGYAHGDLKIEVSFIFRSE